MEKGVEPELVSERIAELRGDKEALEEALAEIGAEREEAEDEELAEQLKRVPDLSKALAEASPEVQPRSSRLSTCRSLMTRLVGGSRSRPPCQRRWQMPSRTRKPSRRRAQRRRTRPSTFFLCPAEVI